MKKDIQNSSANFLLLSSTGIKLVCPTAPKHPLSSRPHLVSQQRPQGDRAVTRSLHPHHALPVTAHYAGTRVSPRPGPAGCSSLEAPPPQIHWDTHSATRESRVGLLQLHESLHLAWPLPGAHLHRHCPSPHEAEGMDEEAERIQSEERLLEEKATLNKERAQHQGRPENGEHTPVLPSSALAFHISPNFKYAASGLGKALFWLENRCRRRDTDRRAQLHATGTIAQEQLTLAEGWTLTGEGTERLRGPRPGQSTASHQRARATPGHAAACKASTAPASRPDHRLGVLEQVGEASEHPHLCSGVYY